jgi:hypothetical protein
MLHMALLVLMSCVRQSHEEQYQQTKPNQTFIVLAVWSLVIDTETMTKTNHPGYGVSVATLVGG